MRHAFGELMERLRRIRTGRQVLYGTLIVAVVAIVAPCLIILAGAQAIFPSAPQSMIGFMLAMRIGVGLFVIAPLAFFILHLIRLQGLAIEEIQKASRYDALTGAMTRGYFLDQTRLALSRGGGLMMIDADCFKAINDTFGHDMGDEALKLMAQVMRDVTGPEALVGRLGGEEFAVFLPDADAERTEESGEALCLAVRKAGRTIAGQPVGLTLSIGAVSVEAGGSLERSLKSADLLLYEAKKAGRDQLVMHRPQAEVADFAVMAAMMRRIPQARPGARISSSAS